MLLKGLYSACNAVTVQMSVTGDKHMAAYSYGRVSTAEQADDGKSSLDQQRTKCAALAHVADCEIDTFFADKGVSGSVKLSERPEGAKLLALLQPGDSVFALKMDRMFRDTEDALATSRCLKKRGVRLYLADVGADPVNSDEGGISKLYFTILAAMAEFERWRIAERMADGRKGKAAKGGHIGGSRPFGFDVTGTGKSASLVPRPDEQRAIALIREWHAAKLSMRAISVRLAEHGFTLSHVGVGRILAK